MTSYIPESTYGLIPGAHDQYGLIPWPAHMKPRGAEEEPRITGANTEPVNSSGVELTKKAEAYVAAALAEADGVFFLTIDKRDRTSIATTVERLINMLDELSPDPDLEPMLGAPETGHSGSQARAWSVPHSDDRENDGDDLEASLGNGGSYVAGDMQYDLEADGPNGGTYVDAEPSLGSDNSVNQTGWASGTRDDREPEQDEEHSSGWQNEGRQDHLQWGDEEAEPSLGFTEAVDQTLAGRMREGYWDVIDGEEDAGDDREMDHDFEVDAVDNGDLGIIWGGGSDQTDRVAP